MSLQESRYAIFESLSGMNHNQTEQVLHYISELLTSKDESEKYQQLKQQAMMEINLALNQEVFA